MKFAKELDENAVPEWKSKYLDYKAAKKKLKAVARAIREVESKTPGSIRHNEQASPFTSLRDAPVKNLLRRSPHVNGNSQSSNAPLAPTRSRSEAPSPQWTLSGSGNNPGDATPRAQPIPAHERSPLRTPRAQNVPHMTRYGSIIGSPPGKNQGADLRPASTLELPMPSLNPEQSKGEQRDLTLVPTRLDTDPDYDRPVSPNDETAPVAESISGSIPTPAPPATQMQHIGDAYDPSIRPSDSVRPSADGTRFESLFKRRTPQRAASTPNGRPFKSRFFSFGGTRNAPVQPQGQDIALEAYREVDFRKAQFFQYLDKELAKIEGFYQDEENKAVERMKALREQLHTLRDRRANDVRAADIKKTGRRHFSVAVTNVADKVGQTSRSMAQLGTPCMPTLETDAPGNAAQQDYVRRHEVSYHTAKRQLKIALQELYRGLELLKSYSLLNRTAFRKILKKYIKASGSAGVEPGHHAEYMSEKVNPSKFVSSEKPEAMIQDIEDLYARYFEKGNHKIAVSKLRAKTAKASDFGGPMFRTGLMLGIAVVFGIQGLVYAAVHYYSDPIGSVRQTHVSYLLQIYGGYFLLLALYTLFVLDARVFETFHVNYPFIFELDNRNLVNWRRITELPSAFACLFGVCIWLNFTHVGGDVMFLYWPVVLIGIAVCLLFAPIPGFFYSSPRKWFSQSMWRLLCAGLYPVEFRDFFLGDMFCSTTYAMGNIELFFCLYASEWSNPGQCNSSSSRLLGFFTALPGILRALQCLRRYWDTRNIYPHLANMGKYGFTILQYMTLSMWRINETSHTLKALFITAAAINSLYCIFWDIINDWSLSSWKLRPILAYRKHKWWYHAAVVEDVLLRFAWIGYVSFPHEYQSQHSSLISFMIALLEVFRRGVWVIFRVENEHCTNVARYRATKQTDLPYPEQAPPVTEPDADQVSVSVVDGRLDGRPLAITTSSELEGQQPSATLSLRRRQQNAAADSPMARALKRVGSTVLNAHAQDYERRRPTAVKEGDSDDEEDSGESDREQ